MGRISFDNYGKRAQILNDYTSISGRYPIQKEAEKYILLDIIEKLIIKPDDTCLDIGCGVGNILIPLSFLVKKITGIDHNLVIEKLKTRFTDSNDIEVISGNFIDLDLKNTYTKIIVYSVLHCLEDENEVIKFIDKTISLLSPGGNILFGDIPNESKKKRFLSTAYGSNFLKEWSKILHKYEETHHSEILNLQKLEDDNKLVKFNDEFVIKIVSFLRNKGYHAYIIPQSPGLPFYHTREDILVEKLL